MNIKQNTKLLYEGILNSYSQVFFSKNKLFGIILIIITFFDLLAGLSGLLAVIITYLAGRGIGFHKTRVSEGIYGFNSLLVGLGLGIYFEPGIPFFFVLFLASLFTLFLSVSMEGIIGKYAIPYLSLPFIISIWLIALATSQFEALGISQRGIYTLNDLYVIGDKTLVNVYTWWNDIGIPSSLRVYFFSLGAIFFQYNLLSGIIIAFGLLYYSRIGFSLSLLGFYSAYVFYTIIGANISEANYSYIGFNYILTAIALGGFFIIPSKWSYFWTIILIPMVAIITISLSIIFSTFNLPIYSLPFNIVVLLFLYVLKFRTKSTKRLTDIFIQHHSPEKNLYAYQTNSVRFKYLLDTSIQLPFWGEWTVSQGHNGEHTHKEEWENAWDFVITDETGRQFKGEGDLPNEYYCYEKDVIAPADGEIEQIIDGIEDNIIGDINLENNWGNSVVIRHNNMLFSQVSHLKKDSIKVKPGERIKKGTLIARVGNSGRSPYPHLHFQFQSSPFVGSRTISYPISHFILSKDKGVELRSYQIPELNEKVKNIEPDFILKNSFHFIPGKRFSFEIVRGENMTEEKWEVITDAYNNSYLQEKTTGSKAYFENDGNLFYFSRFDGDKKLLLYYFFLAAYKIQTGFYNDLELRDKFPVDLLFNKRWLFIHDFFAPFFFFLKADFHIQYSDIDNPLSPEKIELISHVNLKFFRKEIKKIDFKLILNTKGLSELVVIENNKKITATCEN